MLYPTSKFERGNTLHTQYAGMIFRARERDGALAYCFSDLGLDGFFHACIYVGIDISIT